MNMSLDPRQEETEVNESSELEQQEVVQPKREWKKILALVLTMVVAVACFSLAYSALYEAFFGGSSNQAVVSLSKDNHKNHAKEYVKNLKEVNRDEDLIDVYLDEGVDGYYITLFNPTD
ncbi:MAG: hypothetical protein PUF50_01865, partial [Erysipelotrichaceae bacterium]|nr:hypothetical protein [Erysipelotrichaceae bacterium]